MADARDGEVMTAGVLRPARHARDAHAAIAGIPLALVSLLLVVLAEHHVPVERIGRVVVLVVAVVGAVAAAILFGTTP
jgi:hypothetical protein